MKIKKAITAALLCCTLMTGCSVVGIESSELMRPPKATADKAQIQSVIDEQAEDNYILKYPQRGQYRSAVIMRDMDGDGTSEAIAFYSNKNEGTPKTNLLIIAQKKGVWECVGNYSNQSTEVDQVAFADLNADGTAELITGWGAVGSSINQLTAYSFDSTATREIQINQTYASFASGDFTGDGSEELILLTLPSAEAKPQATLLDWNYDSSALFSRGVTALDPNISKYLDVSSQKISDDCTALIAEGATAVGTYATQVIVFDKDNETLKNDLYSQSTQNLTLRDTPVMSQDINGDGIFEIVTSTKMKSEENEDAVTVASETVWNRYNAKTASLERVTAAVIDSAHDYYYIIDADWRDEITARINLSDSTLTFYKWDSAKKPPAKGDKLLTITAKNLSKASAQNELKDFTLIEKTSYFAYAYLIAEGNNELIPTEQQVLENFKIIDKSTNN